MLSNLLISVGIGICNAASEESISACRKCARKIFNCCTTFHGLESAVKARIDEGNSQSTEGGIKRLHGNSLSGSTTNSKKIKDIPQQVQEPRQPKGWSRKSLFQLKADWTERENLEGAIANMQKKACFAFYKAATNWKDEIVTREEKILLLEEVLNRHSETTSQTDDGMAVCTIDFSREAASCCVNFSDAVYTSFYYRVVIKSRGPGIFPGY